MIRCLGYLNSTSDIVYTEKNNKISVHTVNNSFLIRGGILYPWGIELSGADLVRTITSHKEIVLDNTSSEADGGI